MELPYRYRLPLFKPVPALKGAACLRLSSILTLTPDVFLEGALGLPFTALFERAGLGAEFKTMAKAALGKIELTRTTTRTLERKVGHRFDDLAQGAPKPWEAVERGAGLAADWPEARFIRAMVQAEAATDQAVSLRLQSAADFWGSSDVGAYGASVDTCIRAACCAGLPFQVIEPFLSGRGGPFSHFVANLGRALRCANMARTSRVLAGLGVSISDGLLRKWSSDVQLPRRSHMSAICQSLPREHQQDFELSYGIARTLTFFISVLSAAPAEAVAGRDIQTMLLRRAESLHSSQSSPW